ncbi:MAG: T9SS C-terminal target domain-containing protein [Candidatus Zixiibacteriota bacterium]|nr:MAG: T9SS C-terminal target domain-containing protein [candidate division Zixibacteria bacterium]
MKKSWVISIFVLGALMLAATAFAQPPDTLWTRTYGGSELDVGESMQQTFDGGYIIAGYTGNYPATDVFLIKTDVSGDTNWTRAYDGNGDDYSYSVHQTTDGGYIVAGRTDSCAGGNRDVYLVKTNSSGDTLWTRKIDGSYRDEGYCVRQTYDGGYIITGLTVPLSSSYTDVYLIKTDANGDIIWTRTFGGSRDDLGKCVRQTTDGGYVVTGAMASDQGIWDVYLIKTDANGDTCWTRTYGGGYDDQGFSVRQTVDGGYVIAGWTEPFFVGGPRDVYLIKTDSSGCFPWTRTYGGSGYDEGRSVQQTTDGGYIITGMTDSFGAGLYDVYLIRTYADGDTIWTCTFGGSGDELGKSVQQTSDWGYAIAGFTASYGAGQRDVYLIKTAAEPRPLIQVPDSLDFGFVWVDSSALLPLVIRNAGDDTLVIDAMVVSHADFTLIGPASAVIPPLDSLVVSVAFRPMQQAVYSESLTLLNNAQETAVVLSGVGVFAPGIIFPSDPSAGPTEYALGSPLPNPFNATTLISFALPVRSQAELAIFDLASRRVAVLVHEWLDPGAYQVVFDAGGLPSGVYLARLQAGDFAATKKLVLLK